MSRDHWEKSTEGSSRRKNGNVIAKKEDEANVMAQRPLIVTQENEEEELF